MTAGVQDTWLRERGEILWPKQNQKIRFVEICQVSCPTRIDIRLLLAVGRNPKCRPNRMKMVSFQPYLNGPSNGML